MLEGCIQILHHNKVRLTVRRTLLLKLLHASLAPLSVPGLVLGFRRHNQEVNKTTVYRDLDLLEKLGLVEKVTTRERKEYYELSERAHHHHLVCLNCEKIFDLPLDESKLMRAAEDLSDKIQFTIARHAVEFYGYCARCQGLQSLKVTSMIPI